jgi:hypothetical protein
MYYMATPTRLNARVEAPKTDDLRDLSSDLEKYKVVHIFPM